MTYKTTIIGSYDAQKSVVITIYTPFVTVIETSGGGAALSGNILSSVTFAGTLKVKKLLTGDIAANTTWSGTLSTRLQLSGNIAANVTFAGNLGVGGVAPAQLTGDITVSTTFAGLLKTKAQLSGTIAANVDFVSTLSIATSVAQLVGDIPAAVSFAGLLKTKAQLSGNIAADSTFAGTLKTKAQLVGNIAADAAFAGTLSIASGGIDEDAQAFADHYSISDETELEYLDAVFAGLKTIGIYDDAIEFYPFVGGTAAKHKGSGKDPGGTFEGDFFQAGSGAAATHNANGVTHSGTSNTDGSYMQTHVIPSTHMAANDFTVAWYTRSTSDRAGALNWGCVFASGDLFNRWNGTTGVYFNAIGTFQTSSAFGSMSGTHAQSRESSTKTNVWKDGVKIDEFTSDNVTTAPNLQIVIGACNVYIDDVINNCSEMNFCFWIVFSRALTQTEHEDFSDLMTTGQTILSRQV